MGIAERMQEMTMKSGSRPYGCALLGGIDANVSMTEPPLYRVDPSGAMVLLNPSDGSRDHHATANANDSLEMDLN
ncbi:hypothetical protein ACHAXA_000402 [Cyclostephanos tholiformis]|uniref:Uncharacterized protein n=1 Tax=Cyclostephanos tholiformis TaxID=382380 RepID=A0ABD3RTI4_9STRA